jgi:hypothetical protein
MIINDPEVGGENTYRDASGATHTSEGVADSNLKSTAMSQSDDRLAITTSTSFSLEIPESDSATTLDEERQLHPSMQRDPIPGPSDKRSRSLSGSDQADDCDSD